MSNFWRWFLLFISAYFLLNLPLITSGPAVWPDEALMAEYAYNFNQSGKLISNLHGDLYNANQGLYFYTPALPLLYSYVFRIFGFGIYQQRAVALLAGTVMFLLLLIINRKNKHYWWLGIFVIFDYQLMQGSRFSRPEIFILMLTVLNLFLLKSTSKKRIILSMFVSVIACLVHPLGALVLFLTLLYFLLNKNYPYVFWQLLIGFLGVMFWLFIINFEINSLLAVLKLQGARRVEEPTYFKFLSTSTYQDLPLYFNTGLILSILLLIKSLSTKQSNYQKMWLSGLMISWLIVFFGRESWYYIYPMIFIYYWLARSIKTKPDSLIDYCIWILLVVLLFININLTKKNWPTSFLSYTNFTKEVTTVLPKNSTVFISSIPDPYFALKTDNKNFRLYQFPPLPEKINKYLDLLDQTDYIIYTSNYEYGFNNVLDRYIKKNKAKIIIVGQLSNYRAQIIKLVPKYKRSF